MEASAAVRVAICFGTFPPERNGGADFVGRFAEAVASAGARVHVLTSPSDGPEHEVLADGVQVHRVVDDWTIGRGRRTLRRLDGLIEAEGIDVVHVFFPDSVLQGRYQLPALLGRRRAPLVSTFWNIGLGRRSPLAIRLEALALLVRSAVLSSHDPDYVAALRRLSAGRKPVRWLPVGSNFPSGPAAARTADGHTLGFFGQLDFTRGVDTLFEAVAQLDRPGLRVVMIGSAGRPERYEDDPKALAEFERLRWMPERLGIARAVEWTDFLPDADVPRTLASLDVCVLPYRRNSLGRSALAAAFDAGVPVVLGGRPDAVAPLVPGAHVALVPPDDAGALAETLGRLLDDEHERMRLAEGARRAAAFFAWPRIAAQALELYRLALRR
jgi:glycosyltransferase involved in cell wall biosynthesis